MRRDDAAAMFAKDIASHELSILHDDGIYRHIVGKRPGTNCYRFDIVTFPGYLAYTGDMGAFTFTRLTDMFVFFRAAGSHPGSINPPYWAEKLEAVCKTDGYEEFDADLFEQLVRERVMDWAEAREEPFSDEFNDGIEHLILAGRDGEPYAAAALRDFKVDGYEFSDVWEWSMRGYTLRFIWCCHAIVWAISQYDEQKAGA